MSALALQRRFLPGKVWRQHTGKGYALAFFLIFLNLPLHAQTETGSNFPVIRQLTPSDTGFRQFTSDVEGNRRRLAGIMNGVRLRTRPEEIAEHLTIYQYTVREGEDIFFLAARSNIPYSALASLNRLGNPVSLEVGMTLLLPSCPGIFIPSTIETDLEKLIGMARENTGNSVELRIRTARGPMSFLFFPGADFTPTERAFFLNAGFRFPLRSFRVTSPYGIRTDPITGNMSMHRGIDLAAPEGTEVFAVADGVVSATGSDPVYGNYIIIRHSNNWTSLYGHLQSIETVLRAEVKSGNLIGRVGSTGQSTGPHLHFELRQDGRAFDPAGRLRP
ncbi:MAG: M23 family metallopeptidase [Treponema sp.]|nr:M23 family metallopeptidase [Treponema sp.]